MTRWVILVSSRIAGAAADQSAAGHLRQGYGGWKQLATGSSSCQPATCAKATVAGSSWQPAVAVVSRPPAPGLRWLEAVGTSRVAGFCDVRSELNLHS